MNNRVLDANTPLYRFVSMFDLFDLISQRRLRLAKFSTFEDKNEGVGSIIKMQDAPVVRQNYLARESIEKNHAMVRENHYATCWSTEPEKIAMWSLYSDDKSSLRVATTFGQLRDALRQCNEDNSWIKVAAEPGSKKRITWYFSVESVEYVDYFHLRDRVRDRYRTFRQLTKDKGGKDPEYFKPGGGFFEDYRVFRQQPPVVGENGIFQKDSAYEHEHEVRGVIFSGIRNDLTETAWRARDDPFSDLYDWAEPGHLDDFMYAEIPANFIDSACFDPRMPRYKRDVFEALFPSLVGRFVDSRAFGYAFCQESFASDYDGNPE